MPADNASPTGGRAAAQMCSAAALAVGHAWLVLGVFSGLGSTARRADIRATWWRWEALRQQGEARACFILAWGGDRAAVDVAQKEARKHGDVVRLVDATEGCSGCSYSKFYACGAGQAHCLTESRTWLRRRTMQSCTCLTCLPT